MKPSYPSWLQVLRGLRVSEVELNTQLRDPRRDDRGRLQPAGACLDVALVVGRHRARVEDVEQIEPDVGARAAESQELCHAEIDLIDSVAVEITWLDDVHEGRLRPARQGASELGNDLGVGH